MKRILFLPILLLLGGCVSSPVVPGETDYLYPQDMGPPVGTPGSEVAGSKAVRKKAARKKANESEMAGRITAKSDTARSDQTFVHAVTPPKRNFRATISETLREQLMALDPERITGPDVEGVLSKAPAPQVINVHGGVFPVHLVMKDFSKFLAAMGYPKESTRLPGGHYSYSCYKPSNEIAGAVAWYYEESGLPVIMVGHSQGGMQIVKVLHYMEGTLGNGSPRRSWNPETRRFEDRSLFWDVRVGRRVPMADLRPVYYASAVGSGGATVVMPNQWAVANLVRKIPDSTRYFTGYFVAGDFVGGGLGGASGSNAYRPTGRAKVRNMEISWGSEHLTVPRSYHLAKNAASRAWVQNYHPSQGDELPVNYDGSTNNLLWAANVWYEIKKYWCLALQESARRG